MTSHLRIYISLLAIACTFFLSGCITGKAPSRTSSIECATITTNEFASTYRALPIGACSSEGCSFDIAGARLEFYAGLKVIKFGGRIYNMPVAPIMSGQGLLLPTELIDALPAIILKRKYRPAPARAMQVIIDAGHGGKDPGAHRDGVREKDITLDIAKRLQQTLASQGISAQLTRNDDRFLELSERCSIANGCPGAIFVSIHVNAEEGNNARGTETYFIADRISDDSRAKMALSQYQICTRNGGKAEYCTAVKLSSHYRHESETLAGMVQNELAKIPGVNNRGVKEANYAVLRESFFGPALLVEVGFVSNGADRKMLTNTSHRQKLAQAIARGISNYTAGKN